MPAPLSSLISDQHALELEAHISVDDVIAKVYEEAFELAKAMKDNNADEVRKEAHDVLSNVLSVSSRYIAVDSIDSTETEPQSSSPDDIHDLIARWWRETAAIRQRYSREVISLESHRATVSQVLSCLIPLTERSLSSAREYSLQKFRSRIDQYRPSIDLKQYIGEYQDFPKPGIRFRDISPLLADPAALRFASYEMAKHAKGADVIAGLDARGFIFWSRVAEILGKPFVMVRKKWKLPGETVWVDYSLEYGDNSLEMQKGSIQPGSKVAVIDDLLATWGTLAATANLIEKVGWKVSALICLISLDEPFLKNQKARQDIESKYPTMSVLHYDS